MRSTMSIEREHHLGRTEFHVEEISSWDGFDQICRYLMEHLNAELLSQVDGPDARVWEFRVAGSFIVVVHDDMAGNFFFAKQKEGESTAELLASKLDERIKAVNG